MYYHKWPYNYIQLCMGLYLSFNHAPVLQCLILFTLNDIFDSGRLNWTFYDLLWLWMTLLESVSLTFTVFNSDLTLFLIVQFLSIVWICLKCLTFSEIVQLMQLWTNFVVQNGSNDLKKLKKELTVLKLCLRNLDFV